MRAICAGGAHLPDFDWGVWWTNAVHMGVQTGDAFGNAFAKAAGLAEAWSIKPLLSGKEVMSSLGMSSGGPMLGVAMNRLMEWQLENPCASKEDCNQWLNTSLKSELKL